MTDKEFEKLLSEAIHYMLEEYGRELEEKYKDVPPIKPSPEAAARFEKALDEYFG